MNKLNTFFYLPIIYYINNLHRQILTQYNSLDLFKVYGFHRFATEVPCPTKNCELEEVTGGRNKLKIIIFAPEKTSVP
jgi:hypothetical protein